MPLFPLAMKPASEVDLRFHRFRQASTEHDQLPISIIRIGGRASGGDKSTSADKQEHQPKHTEEGYEEKDVPRMKRNGFRGGVQDSLSGPRNASKYQTPVPDPSHLRLTLGKG
jgi:hypothetical protein